MHKTEKLVLLYGALFIAITVNMHRLLNLLTPHQNAIGIPWKFNLPELLFQTLFHFVFCYTFARFNLSFYSKNKPFGFKKLVQLIAINLVWISMFMLLSMYAQYWIFNNAGDLFLYRAGFVVRYVISLGLIIILLNILILYSNQRLKELDNQRLKTIYSDAQLSNLRAQLNPHFLFNALSTLSALMTESTDKAQEYLTSLSQLLRYTLSHKKEQLVSLEEELEFLKINLALLRIKYEEHLTINFDVDNVKSKRIPVMSLQLLLENALKHNIVSSQKPLTINLTSDGETLTFRNNRNPIGFKEVSTGIGLANLQERYALLVDKRIDIRETSTHFTVTLPLI